MKDKRKKALIVLIQESWPCWKIRFSLFFLEVASLCTVHHQQYLRPCIPLGQPCKHHFDHCEPKNVIIAGLPYAIFSLNSQEPLFNHCQYMVNWFLHFLANGYLQGGWKKSNSCFTMLFFLFKHPLALFSFIFASLQTSNQTEKKYHWLETISSNKELFCMQPVRAYLSGLTELLGMWFKSEVDYGLWHTAFNSI